MSNKRKRNSSEAVPLVIAGLSLCAGLTVTFLAIKYPSNNFLLSGVLGAATSIFFMIYAEFFHSRKLSNMQTDEIVESVNSISSILSTKDQDKIDVFVSDVKGLEHNIGAARSPGVIEVKNTVLRYGKSSTATNYGESLYEKWISAKRDSLISRHCTWYEIVSTCIEANQSDPQMEFVTSMLSSHAKYNVAYLDDTANQMLQLCITKFADAPSEVVFGHQFPNMARGQCFRTTNSAVVDYFDKYFDYWFLKARRPLSAGTDSGSGSIVAKSSEDK